MPKFEYAPAPESRAVVDLQPSYGLFIDGEFAQSQGGSAFKSTNPATEEVLAEVTEASEADVDRAVAAARRAYDGVWGRMSGADRGMDTPSQALVKGTDEATGAVPPSMTVCPSGWVIRKKGTGIS